MHLRGLQSLRGGVSAGAVESCLWSREGAGEVRKMHTLEIAFNTFCSNALRKDDCAALDRPAYKELGGRLAEPGGRVDDDGVVDGSVIVS